MFPFSDQVKKFSFIENDKCPEVTWHADKHGLCDIDIVLTFIQKDNTTKTITMPVRNEIFRNCDYTSNAIEVEYKTELYLKKDENNNQISNSVQYSERLTKVEINKGTFK